MKTFALTLSGGGARGFAHLGILDVLGSRDLKPVALSGTSMGAIMSVFYAAGYRPKDVIEILQGEKLFSFYNLRKSTKGGILNMDFLRNILDKYIGDIKFEDLEIPVTVCATNLNTGEAELFSSGPYMEYVVASASIPFVFEPVKMGNRLYLDGGMVNNMPADALIGKADKILGVHVNHSAHIEEFKGFSDVLKRVQSLTIKQNVKFGMSLCDMVIEPRQTAEYDILELKRYNEIYELGRSAALDKIDEFCKILE
jgi:NTE family protein